MIQSYLAWKKIFRSSPSIVSCGNGAVNVLVVNVTLNLLFSL